MGMGVWSYYQGFHYIGENMIKINNLMIFRLKRNIIVLSSDSMTLIGCTVTIASLGAIKHIGELNRSMTLFFTYCHLMTTMKNLVKGGTICLLFI